MESCVEFACDAARNVFSRSREYTCILERTGEALRSRRRRRQHDPILKDLEITALIRHLDDHLDTLEVGTGNGVNLRRLSATFTGRLVGVDYSEEMIRVARQMVAEVRPGSDIMFVQEDVLGRLSRIGRFPQ